jgi:hypothetical protein
MTGTSPPEAGVLASAVAMVEVDLVVGVDIPQSDQGLFKNRLL